MMGFASDIEVKQVRLASGVTVHTDASGNMVLIGLNKAPYLEHNMISLLLTNQSHEHGVWVDDVLHHHCGTQKICAAVSQWS